MTAPPFFSFGFGVGTQNSKGEWLEVFYPQPLLAPAVSLVDTVAQVLDYQGGNQVVAFGTDKVEALVNALKEAGEVAQSELVASFADSKRPLVATFIEEDTDPKEVAEVYLKLHLLSHRLVKPHGANLNGMFGALPNVAWTNQGAIDLEELPQRQLQARLNGEALSVDCVDKFPKMVDYVVPAGTRIADTARVRLGAYLGAGTTIMHEGFVNFNAGTEGPGMIEGRISAGVFVGKGSDLGGGCSTMGTLSGGGNIIISVGDECLIGANAGIGIPLGDRCIVEAGLYITAGSKVNVLDDNRELVEVARARDLAGKDDLLFRRNSQNGAIECLTNKSAIELNEALHANN
ncbi:2,3,4,5-tetrahydropyridine-2,6-dicarboxylate N-succinyltransferase [Oceanospirillum beijerinckii]|uniref:2,3,4,5-tetrahydropyridine-2,6-dicarboxylate N-succinyltransferase n=1 Tax=Oceanospirillum beijerinckii TaxID=64976 RepID=UPI0003FE276D|nr:2,3,4,5-tetrahydropyridine-2,6-dicarboxylate N-succinyltransferase [Oceanospirillum beijerinckii]